MTVSRELFSDFYGDETLGEAIDKADRAHDLICRYEDPFGGPCILPVADHPFRMAPGFNGKYKKLVHDDGKARR